MPETRLTERIAALAARCEGGNHLVTGDLGVVQLPWSSRRDAQALLDGVHALEESRYSVTVRDRGGVLTILLDCPDEHLALAAARLLFERTASMPGCPSPEQPRPRYGSGGYAWNSGFASHAEELAGELSRAIGSLAAGGAFGSEPETCTAAEGVLAALLDDVTATRHKPYARALAYAVLTSPDLVRTAAALSK